MMHTRKSCPNKSIRKIKNSLLAYNFKYVYEIIETTNIEISFGNYYIFRNLKSSPKLDLDNLYIMEKLILMSWNEMSDETKHKNMKICLTNIWHYIQSIHYSRYLKSQFNDLSLSLISVMEEILSTGYRPNLLDENPFHLLFRHSTYNRNLNQNEGIFLTLRNLVYKYYDFDDYLSKIDEKEMDLLTLNHEMAFEIVERNPKIAINHPTYMELLISYCLNKLNSGGMISIYFNFLVSTYSKKQILPRLLNMWKNSMYNSIGIYNRNNGQIDFEVDFFKDLHKFVNGGTFTLVQLPSLDYNIRDIGMVKFSEWRYDLGDLSIKGFNDLLNDYYDQDSGKFEGTRYVVSDGVLTKIVIDIFTDLQIVFINISWVEILDIFYLLCPSWFERICKKDNNMIERKLQRIHTYSKKFAINLQ